MEKLIRQTINKLRSLRKNISNNKYSENDLLKALDILEKKMSNIDKLLEKMDDQRVG